MVDQSSSTTDLQFNFLYTKIRQNYAKNAQMDDSFKPGPTHVISEFLDKIINYPFDFDCGLTLLATTGGRGKQSYNHAGNIRYRMMIYMHMHSYREAPSKLDKSLIVISIVDAFRSVNGGFVRKLKGGATGWIDIGDQLAREKTGHALRDAINARLAEGQIITRDFADAISVDQLMKVGSDGLDVINTQLKMEKIKNNPTIKRIVDSIEPTVATETPTAVQSKTIVAVVQKQIKTTKQTNLKAAEHAPLMTAPQDNLLDLIQPQEKRNASAAVEVPTSFHMIQDSSMIDGASDIAEFVLDAFSEDEESPLVAEPTSIVDPGRTKVEGTANDDDDDEESFNSFIAETFFAVE